MKKMLVLLAVLAGLAIGPQGAGAAPPPDLLTQVQGADVLADLLTYTATRADARVSVMQQFLRETGKTDAYNQASPRPKMPPQLSFEQVTSAAILFVQNGGDQYADPDLNTMNDGQLTQQQKTLTNYNRGEFMHILQQRAAAASMRVYLESIGQFDQYEDWADGKLPATNPATTGPAAADPAEAAARMDQTVQWIRDIEWKKSEAEGLSQADFDKKWQTQLTNYHDAIAAKLDGSQRLAAAFAKSQPAPIGSPYKVPSQPDYGTNPAPAQAAPPAPVASPYTKESFRDANYSLWNMWDDNYYDTRYRR